MLHSRYASWFNEVINVSDKIGGGTMSITIAMVKQKYHDLGYHA